MALAAFKPLNAHNIGVEMRCGEAGYPSPVIGARPTMRGVVLRCGCTDRVLADPAIALTDEGTRGH